MEKKVEVDPDAQIVLAWILGRVLMENFRTLREERAKAKAA